MLGISAHTRRYVMTLVGVTALLAACGQPRHQEVSSCLPPVLVFTTGNSRISVGHCSGTYFSMAAETVRVGQRIKAVDHAGNAAPFSDDQRILREIYRSADGHTAEYQAVRTGGTSLDVHYGPPCPNAQAGDGPSPPVRPDSDVCAVLPIRVAASN